MTKPWTCPDDVIVDCVDALSKPGLENGFSRSDLIMDLLGRREDLMDGLDIVGLAPGVEVDISFPDFGSECDLSGHPLSNAVDGSDLWKDLETDLVVGVLEPELSDPGQLPMFRYGPRSSHRSAFVTSALVHTTFLGLMAFFPAAHVAGTTGGTGNVVMMRVVAQEDVVPQDQSPASIDSVASAPSKARKFEHREQPPSEPPEAQPDFTEGGPDYCKLAMNEEPSPTEPKREHKETEPSKKPNDKQDGDAAQDALASMPSTASAERRFVSAAGQQGNALDALVLSAIREAIFFPRAAFRRRHHGEVVVAFAITRDGSVADLRITKPSESEILDQAAVKIIEKAAKKFPPIPDTIYRQRLEYVVPILFKKKGS